MAVAARSLAAADAEVTLPQYRVLVILAGHGPLALAEVASLLGVNPSTATRMCDRLVRKGLVRRRTPPADRRQVRLSITEAGRQVVADVTDLRRREINRVLRAIRPRHRQGLVESLEAFAQAAGEVPDRDWAVGWEW